MNQPRPTYGDPIGKVNAALRELRQAWKLGRELAERIPRHAKYGKGAIEGEAKRLKLNPDIVRKLRQIGDPELGYSDRELDELCRQCREYRRAIGASYLYKFVSVPKARNQRARFQLAVIKGHWSSSQVRDEIRARFGRRKQGGNRPAVARSKKGVLSQLDSLCVSVERYLLELENSKKPKLGDLSPAIQKQLVVVARETAKLRSVLAGNNLQ